MSQEQLADQVVKTSEEKHNVLKELDTVKKVRRRTWEEEGGEGMWGEEQRNLTYVHYLSIYMYLIFITRSLGKKACQ